MGYNGDWGTVHHVTLLPFYPSSFPSLQHCPQLVLIFFFAIKVFFTLRSSSSIIVCPSSHDIYIIHHTYMPSIPAKCISPNTMVYSSLTVISKVIGLESSLWSPREED